MSTSIGENIRSLREGRGMSLSELARRSHISRGYLHLIEKEDGNPTQEKLIAIAKALEVSVSQIIGEKPERSVSSVTIPESLLKFAESERLNEDEVQMLSQINYRGKHPDSPREWEILYSLIKTLSSK